MSNFSFCHNVSDCLRFFYFLTKYVQSRLLHNCRMRERVNPIIMFPSYILNGDQSLKDNSFPHTLHMKSSWLKRITFLYTKPMKVYYNWKIFEEFIHYNLSICHKVFQRSSVAEVSKNVCMCERIKQLNYMHLDITYSNIHFKTLSFQATA